ncbi:hypothetical protein C8J56DRAFT_919513 [Mycena floridula]|nr:hypothetical protein C8J56DRAFT_919513 [Mycena floridula]
MNPPSPAISVASQCRALDKRRLPFSDMSLDLNLNTAESFLFLDKCDPDSPVLQSMSSFRPLPLIPPLSSMQLVDFTFQSFSVSPKLPVLPTLSQPLFPTQETGDVLHIPSLHHPNSPYYNPLGTSQADPVPRPVFPTSTCSHYPHRYSCSGAIAPEPVESLNHSPTTLLKMTKSLRSLRRSVSRNASQVARRLKSSFIAGSSIHQQQEGWIDLTRSPSVASFDSTSIALWLTSRQRDNQETFGQIMTLEEYERAGSWLDLTQIGCGLAGCELHFTNTGDETDTTTNESSILRTLDPDLDSSSSLRMPGAYYSPA